jgi:hypothetical protein
MVCGRYELEEMEKTCFSEKSVQLYNVVEVVRDIHRENMKGAT